MQVGGAWQNEQGALMRLALEPDGFLHGDYRPAGSADHRLIAGYTGGIAPDHGMPLALAMSWRPVEPGPARPDWHWMSCFGGELLPADGPMQGLHQIVATAGCPSVAEAGTHLERLDFRRVGPARPMFSRPVLAARNGETLRRAAADPVEGVWRAIDEDTSLTLHLRNPHAGIVVGSLSDRHGETVLCGFADIDTGEPRMARQSLALAGLCGGAALALSGSLDLERGLLTLGGLLNRGTTTERYGQTLIEGMRFKPA